MGVGAGLYMYVVVVQKFTFAISSPDEFLSATLRLPRDWVFPISLPLCGQKETFFIPRLEL